ncbi:hypothetical protein [Hugenholtzia roseola]|uniref:hypothetical protein n=1 Tax=Hugenholtzia roseola TaxID=1002 RepID=UPI0003FB3C36|nr:hypothetical protein [Hugenholtzia roseola]
MIIANPIYDVVFKKLMENEKVAKFFIGTLLEETIESIELKPQEYTYKGELETSEGIEAAEARLRQRFSIWVYRLDFIATIRTQSGELKKVLIEIQKAKNLIDLMRFRNYLAEQYKKEDKIDNEKIELPITTIYILGFKLPEIESPCIKVERNYRDLVHKTTLHQKSDFIEKLTHDSFVIQVERITDRYQTRLDKLLSIFEQRNFTDEKEITKNYVYSPDIEEMKTITEILHYVGTDPKERKQIEIEQEAWRSVSAMFEEKERRYQKELEAQRKALAEKDQALNEKDKLIAELMKKLNQDKK